MIEVLSLSPTQQRMLRGLEARSERDQLKWKSNMVDHDRNTKR